MEKTCKACKHAKRDLIFGWEFATCEAPQNKKINLVSGRHAYKFSKYAEVQRVGDLGDCGEAGRWFEQRHPRTTWLRVFGA